MSGKDTSPKYIISELQLRRLFARAFLPASYIVKNKELVEKDYVGVFIKDNKLKEV